MLSEAERSGVLPPRFVELPSGGAWVLDLTYLSPAHDEGLWQSALYQLEANGGALIECGGPARPKGDWRSIVDTFEFLVDQQ